MGHGSEFGGFERATLRFLTGLVRHNSREWLAQHRADYEAHYVGAAAAFVEAVAPRLRRLVPALKIEPRVGGSIFRLQKDARFAPRERPLREHLEIWFWEGERAAAASVFSMRLEADRVLIGGGCPRLGGARRAAYRGALADPGATAALERVVRGLARSNEALEYGADDRSDSTRRDLWAQHTAPVDLALTSELVPQCLGVWKDLRPLHRWVLEHLQEAGVG